MEARPLVYYVYYSQQKIMQLYRQLPESRTVLQKSSFSRNSHVHADMQPTREPSKEKPLHVSHLDNSGSENCYHESMFDKNEMYQLERVLRALRGCGQLLCAGKDTTFCPGKYYEAEGCFAPAPEEDVPEGYLRLRAPGSCRGPELSLLCHLRTFTGECPETPWEEVWACGEPLPLRGVVLCLARGEGVLCGLPLVLSLD